MFILFSLFAVSLCCNTVTKDPTFYRTNIDLSTTPTKFLTAISCSYSKGDSCVAGGKAGAVKQIKGVDPYKDPQRYVENISNTTIYSTSYYFNVSVYNIISLRVSAALSFIDQRKSLPDYCNTDTIVTGAEILSCSDRTDATEYVIFANNNGCSAVAVDHSCLFLYCNNLTSFSFSYSYWSSTATGISQRVIDRTYPNFILPSTSSGVLLREISASLFLLFLLF